MRRWAVHAAALVGALVHLPLLLRPHRAVHADRYRAFDWMEAAKWRHHAREALLTDGRLPLWNPFLEGGIPGHAHPSDGSLTPSFLTSLAFGETVGMKLDVVLLAAIGAAGTAALARRWLGLSEGGSFFAGACFGVAGWTASGVAVGFYESLYLALIPGVLALLTVAVERGRQGLPWLVGGALLLSWGAGQMQLCLLFAVLVIGIWAAAVRLPGDLKLPRVAPAAFLLLVLVGLLGAVKWLPMLELLDARGYRSEDHVVHEGSAWSAGIGGPIRGLVLTADARGVYEGGEAEGGEYDYGGVPLVALLLALAAFARPRREAALLALLVVTLLLGWAPDARWQPSLFALLAGLPFFDAVRDTSRYVSFFAVLWICLLAARSLVAAQGRWDPRLVLGVALLLLLPQGLRSARLSASIFDARLPAVVQAPAFQHVLLDRPSHPDAGDANLLLHQLARSGTGVLYRAEDLPPPRPSPVHPAARMDARGVLHTMAPRPEAWFAGGDGMLGPLEPGADRLTVVVQTTAPARVVLNHNHHAGWRGPAGTTVDSQGGLLAVSLDRAWSGPLTLRFRPTAFRWGAAGSLIGLLLCGGLVRLGRR